MNQPEEEQKTALAEALEASADLLALYLHTRYTRTGDDTMTQEQKEQTYQEHVKYEEVTGGIHPDGCFYCGRNHPSDCCPNQRDKDEYWKEDPEEA